MESNPLFPVFLKLESLHTLVVGGGNVALEKVTAILKNSPHARVTIVAGSIKPEIRIVGNEKNVKYIERDFENTDLDTADIVILATNNSQLHGCIREAARARRLLVNVADTPDLCDFYLGAVVTKGQLKIGISTNGKSPTIAKRIRELLEEAIPDSIDDLLENMQSLRNQLKATFTEKVKVLNEVTKSWTAGGIKNH